MSVVEERIVKLGLKEFLELLKLAFLSTTPLTCLFISKIRLLDTSVPKLQFPQKKIHSDYHSRGERTMNVKAVLKKSNKEFLFAEARQDFIDFLFSFFIIPLGEMLHIMDGQSGVGSVDGLYKSVVSLGPQYFMFEYFRYLLVRLNLPPSFNRNNHLFPLESTPVIYNIAGNVKEMLVNGGFLREEGVFFVLDNLEVIPFSAASAISIYSRNNISVSDMEERTITIGIEEGISILRASLSSSSAISDGLLHKNLTLKQPKQ